MEYRRCLPAKSFVWSCPGEKVRIDAIEIGKVRVYLQHPIALSENDGADINTADCGAKEWLVLEPCNNVVKSPRHNHASRSRGKIPAVARRLKEDEEAIRNGNDKLSSHRWSAREGRSIDQKASNLDENEFVQKHLSSHIRNGEHYHEHQRAHHHALRPCFKRQVCWVRRFRRSWLLHGGGSDSAGVKRSRTRSVPTARSNNMILSE